MRLHLRSLFPRNPRSKNDFFEQTNVTKADNNQTEGDVAVDIDRLDNEEAEIRAVRPTMSVINA